MAAAWAQPPRYLNVLCLRPARVRYGGAASSTPRVPAPRPDDDARWSHAAGTAEETNAAVFGGSHVQVSGPTGAMVVVLAPIVATHGVGAIAVVSVMAGLMVAAAGVLQLGRTVSLIPWPVIEGFTAGIAFIIFLQQVPSAVGVSGTGHSTNALVAAVQAVWEASWPGALLPVAVAAAVAVTVLLLSKLDARIPAAFAAIVVVTVIAELADLPLARIGELPDSLPLPHFPALGLDVWAELVGPAFAVAALAAIESLLSARVAASMADTGPYNGDRVLMVTAVRMVSPQVVRQVMHSTGPGAAIFRATWIITVSFDLILAVGIGMAAAAFFALRAISRTSDVERQELPAPAALGDERIALFRIVGALFFGAAEKILEHIESYPGVEVVILRLSQLQLIDATGAHTLAEIVTGLENRGVTVLIKGVRPEHMPVLERMGVISSLRHPKHLFADLGAAVAHARSHIARADAAGAAGSGDAAGAN